MEQNERTALRQAQERGMRGEYGGGGVYVQNGNFSNSQDEDYGVWDPNAYAMSMNNRTQYQGYNRVRNHFQHWTKNHFVVLVLDLTEMRRVLLTFSLPPHLCSHF